MKKFLAIVLAAATIGMGRCGNGRLQGQLKTDCGEGG